MVYLRIVSNDADPDQVTSMLGLQPDKLTRKGERPYPKARESKFSSWKKILLSEDSGGRPEDAAAIILGWGTEIAQRLGGLVDTSIWDASLVVVQRVDDLDDQRQVGVWFSREMVAWMATARLALDIDQYIIVD